MISSIKSTIITLQNHVLPSLLITFSSSTEIFCNTVITSFTIGGTSFFFFGCLAAIPSPPTAPNFDSSCVNIPPSKSSVGTSFISRCLPTTLSPPTAPNFDSPCVNIPPSKSSVGTSFISRCLPTIPSPPTAPNSDPSIVDRTITFFLLDSKPLISCCTVKFAFNWATFAKASNSSKSLSFDAVRTLAYTNFP
ncbi:hypothetical protein ECH_0700 [Ehrlichia chaffeensis str. Arkansas]|uniref:Uncharacterized protein n=1 Tax=Ehrlichia chaffeensis (strain ATCC CRL-10679 / Arkansas) TaxID=205920 RepID=Q2GGC8_EHRCR|nr:hypothetical protein ECH_0700 [Ehrlichia chaffeensis str. Arkansas]